MEEKYFLDEKGLKELGNFLWQYYETRDRHEKDFLEIDHRLVNLEHPKVLPDNTDIKDIKTDGLYMVNGITMEGSPVKWEFWDYQAEQHFGRGWNGEDGWHLNPNMSPYMLLRVTHVGNDILYFLFNNICDITHYGVYNSKRDSLRWLTKELSFSLRNDIIDLINKMFYDNPSIQHYVNDECIEGLYLSSPYIHQAELHYNSDNITAKVMSHCNAGHMDHYEETDEGTFLLGATENSAGVMSADDKKKLNSIDIEKYGQQEKDIKSMKEEIALLKSQIEKLQASVNNKE